MSTPLIPPDGTLRLDLIISQLDREYRTGFWLYTPRLAGDEALVIEWLTGSFLPIYTDFHEPQLSIYTVLKSVVVELHGPAGFRIDQPTSPITGVNGNTLANNTALVSYLAGTGVRRGGHSVQHWPGIGTYAFDDGQTLNEAAWGQCQYRLGNLFNSALLPFAESQGGYVATLSTRDQGQPRPSPVLLPGSALRVSRRMGTLRRRMRT